VPHVVPGSGDDFLLTDDQAPNANGCRLLGLEEWNEQGIKNALNGGNYKVLVLLNDDLIGRNIITSDDLSDIYTITFATNHTETAKAADLVVPITCIAEHAASYVSVDGYIQRSYPAKETKYTNRRLDLEMSEGRLDRFGTDFDNWRAEENKVDCLPLFEFLQQLSDRVDHQLPYSSHRDILDEIATQNEAFQGINYERMDEENGVKLELPGVPA
jgi:NADH-quinone oxidoreductase subunit G